MTITTDIDEKIAEEEVKVQHGKRPKPMALRMGPSAFAALCACHPERPADAGREWRPTHYRKIHIEAVFASSGEDPAEVTSSCFNGWELRA